jgi:hypothetical protein
MMSRGLSLIIVFSATVLASAQWPSFLGKGLPIWEKELQSRDAQERHAAAWALAQVGTPAWSELQLALRHDDPVVRYWAVLGTARVQAIKEQGITQQSVYASLRRALKDPAAAVRIEAADRIARLGFVDEALPILIASLEDPQESAGVQAAAALVALGKQAAPARAKLEVAAEKGGEYVKRLATKALAQLQE